MARTETTVRPAKQLLDLWWQGLQVRLVLSGQPVLRAPGAHRGLLGLPARLSK
jgi:hypothetical protein